MSRIWNEEETAILRALNDSGATAIEIRDRMKRSLKGIRHMLAKLGISRGVAKRRFWTKDRMEILRAGIDGGGTLDQVAAAIGTTGTAVRRKCQRIGWTPPRFETPPERRKRKPRVPKINPAIAWTADEVSLLSKLAGEGLSSRLIASRLNRSRDAVAVKAKKLGISIGAPVEKRRRIVNGGIHYTSIFLTSDEPSHLRHIAQFLRERGYGLQFLGDGRFKLDRREVDTAELVAVANRNRRLMNKPEFTEETRETIPDKHSEDPGISFGAAA